MSDTSNPGYLPGDPRYGLYGDALKDYYRNKPAQWAIYCWDIGEPSARLRASSTRYGDAVLRTAMPGMADKRRALLAEQKAYVKSFGERDIGYGHFVSDDGRDTLGTVVLHAARRLRGGGPVRGRGADEQARRLRASRNPPLVEQLRQARGRLRPQGNAAVPLHGAQDRHAGVLPLAPARARNRTSRRMARASSSAGRSARPTAPTTSAPRS